MGPYEATAKHATARIAHEHDLGPLHDNLRMIQPLVEQSAEPDEVERLEEALTHLYKAPTLAEGRIDFRSGAVELDYSEPFGRSMFAGGGPPYLPQPIALVQALIGARDLRPSGERDTLRGEPVERVECRVDLIEADRQLPDGLGGPFMGETTAFLRGMPLTLWLDADGRARRIVFAYNQIETAIELFGFDEPEPIGPAGVGQPGDRPPRRRNPMADWRPSPLPEPDVPSTRPEADPSLLRNAHSATVSHRSARIRETYEMAMMAMFDEAEPIVREGSLDFAERRFVLGEHAAPPNDRPAQMETPLWFVDVVLGTTAARHVGSFRTGEGTHERYDLTIDFLAADERSPCGLLLPDFKLVRELRELDLSVWLDEQRRIRRVARRGESSSRVLDLWDYAPPSATASARDSS